MRPRWRAANRRALRVVALLPHCRHRHNRKLQEVIEPAVRRLFVTMKTSKHGRCRNGAKTSPQTAAAKIKAAKALELRMEGKTFEVIAQEAGYNSKQAAFDAVRRSLAAITREPAEELVRLDLERLDVLWGIQYLNAQAGDVQAMAACMKLMERRAKLLGLDAPVKQEVHQEVTTKSGVLVVPAPIDAASWEAAAKAQQAERDG